MSATVFYSYVLPALIALAGVAALGIHKAYLRRALPEYFGKTPVKPPAE